MGEKLAWYKKVVVNMVVLRKENLYTIKGLSFCGGMYCMQV